MGTWKERTSGAGQGRTKQLQWKVNKGEGGLGSVRQMGEKGFSCQGNRLAAMQLVRERSVWRELVRT